MKQLTGYQLIFQQLWVILWKAWIIRKRHWLSTIIELIVALGLILLVAFFMSMMIGTSGKGKQGSKMSAGIKYNESFLDFPDVLKEISSNEFVNKFILYSPDTEATKRMMKQMNAIYRELYKKSTSDLTVKGFATVQELLDWRTQNLNHSNEMSAIVFTNLPDKFASSSDEISYEIRSRQFDLETTKNRWGRKLGISPNDSGFTSYMYDFLPLQILANEAYLDLKAKDLKDLNLEDKRKRLAELSFTQIPYPPYESGEDSVDIIEPIMPAFFASCFIISFPLIIKRLTDEKVNGAREMFKMMGLNDWVYWGGNFIHHFSFLYVITLVAIAILYAYKIFYFSNCILIVMFFLLYIAQTVESAFFLSILFNRPVVGIVIGVIYWILTQAPGIVLSPFILGGEDYGKLWSCLSPNAAIAFGLRIILAQESFGDGANFSNLNKEYFLSPGVTLGSVMGMMFASLFLTGFLIWYLDNVWPWQPGVPKPVWYLFTPGYWFPKKHIKQDVAEEVRYDPRYFEKKDSSAPVAIGLKNVSKVYGKIKKKVAVDNISLNIYKDEITCLLGHNGAGKTTTMSMMTGMFPPSSGKIYVNGIDLLKNTKEARRSMSICPQHNPLYTALTVREHLILYGAIKGYKWSLLPGEVEKVISEVTLEGEGNKLAPHLSGGMKRKLCLGIALVGDTKIVVLDEPTSGLDTEVRRNIWDLLRQARRSRTILLSTHDMEEADALGDRIVIMSDGQLTCAGTSMFLKSVFGAGYTLKIAKLPDFKLATVSTEVRKFFPKTQVQSNIGAEVFFSLESENNQTDSSVLPAFFRELEHQKSLLGIESFGLSSTTMEDVFLKVGEMSQQLLNLKEGKDLSENSMLNVNGVHSYSSNLLSRDTIIPLSANVGAGERLSRFGLVWQRIVGLFMKRVHYGKRYWPMLLFQVVIPALMLLFSFVIVDVALKLGIAQSALDLNLVNIYGKNHLVLYQNIITSNTSDVFVQYFKGGLEVDGLSIKHVDGNEDLSEEIIANDYAKLTLYEAILKFVLGATVMEPKTPGTFKVNLWINGVAIHAPPLAVQRLYRALEAEMFGDASIPERIHVTSNPLPSDDQFDHFIFSLFVIIILSFLWSFLLPISITFLAASYVLFPVQERLSKAKLIQVMTGLHPILLHGVNFVYDVIQHLVAVGVIMIVILIFDNNKIFFYSGAATFTVFLLLLLLGVAAIPMAYLISLVMKKTSTAFAILVTIYVITGFIFSVVGTILQKLVEKGVAAQSTANVVNWLFSVSPVYTFSVAMGKVYEQGTQKFVCEKIPVDKSICDDSTPFGDEGVGQEIIMMIVAASVALVLLILSETGLLLRAWTGCTQLFHIFSPTRPEAGIDEEDVAKEKQTINDIVASGSYSTDALVVNDLVKQFKSFHAVKGISFVVHYQECFGLLGVNGAGKTTTFGMITGDLEPTLGNCYQGNTDVLKNRSAYQKQIGYCPQFDPLLDKMTGREMLKLFARLRGIRTSNLKAVVNQLIEMVDLTKHADKTTESYSGGNKRKLSLALSLIANPGIILLDEPTAGIDPRARRKLWSLLSFIRRVYSCSIVLTSHSMQECETLCSRLGIMVAGEIKCLGSAQQLRSKYGRGYTLMIKLPREKIASEEWIQTVRDHIQLSIPGSIFTDQHETLWTIRVPDQNVKWSTLFEVMEDMKTRFEFEDYTVSDMTLEQIFIAFARDQ